MTRAEAMIKAICAATGETEEYVSSITDMARNTGHGKMLDEPVSDELADRLIEAAKNDPDSVKRWLAAGYLDVVKNSGHC